MPESRPHPCGCPHLRAGDVCAAHEAERFQAGNLERLGRMSEEQRAQLGHMVESVGIGLHCLHCDEHEGRCFRETGVEEFHNATACFQGFVEASR